MEDGEFSAVQSDFVTALDAPDLVWMEGSRFQYEFNFKMAALILAAFPRALNEKTVTPSKYLGPVFCHMTQP